MNNLLVVLNLTWLLKPFRPFSTIQICLSDLLWPAECEFWYTHAHTRKNTHTHTNLSGFDVFGVQLGSPPFAIIIFLTSFRRNNMVLSYAQNKNCHTKRPYPMTTNANQYRRTLKLSNQQKALSVNIFGASGKIFPKGDINTSFSYTELILKNHKKMKHPRPPSSILAGLI